MSNSFKNKSRSWSESFGLFALGTGATALAGGASAAVNAVSGAVGAGLLQLMQQDNYVAASATRSAALGGFVTAVPATMFLACYSFMMGNRLPQEQQYAYRGIMLEIGMACLAATTAASAAALGHSMLSSDEVMTAEHCVNAAALGAATLTVFAPRIVSGVSACISKIATCSTEQPVSDVPDDIESAKGGYQAQG